jgi:predicted metal-binding membrane protein
VSIVSRARQSTRDIIPAVLGAIAVSAAFALALGAGRRIAPLLCGGGTTLLPVPELSVFLSPWALIAVWLLMLTAMMPMLLIVPVRHLWDRSFSDQRASSIAAFSLAYVGVWTLAGAPLLAAALSIRATGPAAWVAAVMVVTWHISPARQVCFNRCHRRPSLGGFGVRNIVDAAAYGASHGVWCTAACWPLMLAPLVLPQHQSLAMGVATLLLAAERIEPPAPPRWGGRAPVRAVRITVSAARRWTSIAARAQGAA